MANKAKLAFTVAALLLLSVNLPEPHVAGFSSSQLPAIRIGEQNTSNYGTLTPWGGLAFDQSGNLWVADSQNNRVLEFRPPFSNDMNAAVVIGQTNLQRTDAATAANRMNNPMYVTFDASSNLWVSDSSNNRLLEFQPPFFTGMNSSLVIGQEKFTTAFENNTTQNSLSNPGQVAFDSSGNLWVPDGGNGRILEYQPPFTTGMNASLVLGEPDFTHRYCDPHSLGIQTRCSNHSSLTGPTEVAFDQKGNLWAPEAWSSTFGISVFKPPFSDGMHPSFRFDSVYAQNLAFDSDGDLWIACWFCGHVAEFKPPFGGNSISWWNGTAPNATTTLGGGECCGLPWQDSMPNVMRPSGLAFDSAGNLWVVDDRLSWLMVGLIGRVVGYDAQVHPLDTLTGRVRFENRAGLLVPLIAIPSTEMDSISFPEGLFNFTIQGLQPDGSVTLTVTFAQPVSPGSEWLSKTNGHWAVLPANQTDIQGSNMTLLLNNASGTGVISVFGGPAYPPRNLTSITETTSSIIMTTPLSTQNGTALQTFILAVMAVAVIVTVAVAIRKRPGWRGKHD